MSPTIPNSRYASGRYTQGEHTSVLLVLDGKIRHYVCSFEVTINRDVNTFNTDTYGTFIGTKECVDMLLDSDNQNKGFEIVMFREAELPRVSILVNCLMTSVERSGVEHHGNKVSFICNGIIKNDGMWYVAHNPTCADWMKATAFMSQGDDK